MLKEVASSYRISNGERITEQISDSNRFGSKNRVNLHYDDASVYSDVDGSDKFTQDCFSCVALVCFGLSKTDKAPVTALAHINSSIPSSVYPATFKRQREDLTTQLDKVAQDCAPGTTSAVLAGGYISGEFTHYGLLYDPDLYWYKTVVDYLQERVKERLGTSLRVIQGPKTSEDPDNRMSAYVVTRSSTVTVFGSPHVFPSMAESFMALDLGHKITEWKKTMQSRFKENY